MNSSNMKNKSRSSANGPVDAQETRSSALPGNNGDAPDRDREPHPVQVNREVAERNIPSDPDPDDPVSP